MRIGSGINAYFFNLDALRFFSFLCVFFNHTIRIPETGSVAVDFILSLFTLKFLGVSFSFTLSSFLITFRLLHTKEKDGTISLRKFYTNRILRIWPIYFLLLVICYILIPAILSLLGIPSLTLPPILPFLFFYANFYMIEHGESFTFALSILWAISIEEQFYIFWGFISKHSKKNHIEIVVFALYLFSIMFSYYYLLVLNKTVNNLLIHSIFILQNFCSGACIAIICFRKNKIFQFMQGLSAYWISSVYLLLPLTDFLISDKILLNLVRCACYSIIFYD